MYLILMSIGLILTVLIVAGFKYLRIKYHAEEEDIQESQYVMLGIDGADWKIIEPLIEQGKLPNFKRLMMNSAYGNLTPESPFSPPSWASIASGKTVEHHGVYHFSEHLSGQIERVFAKHRFEKVKNLWEIIEEGGEDVGVLGWLFMPQQYPVKDFDRKQKILFALSLGIGFLVRIVHTRIWNYINPKHETARMLLENLRLDYHTALTSYMLNRKRKKFFALVLRGSDSFQHLFWKYKYSQEYIVDSRKLKKYRSTIDDYYIKTDKFIGKLTSKGQRKIMIISDHGFRGFSCEAPQPLWLMYHVDYEKLLHTLGLLHFKNGRKDIDWERTKVYSCGDPLVFHEIAVNLKGREPFGSVSRDDYDSIKNLTKNALEGIKFKDTGEKLYRKIVLHDGSPFGKYLDFTFLDESYKLWNNDAFDIFVQDIYACRYQDSSFFERKVVVGTKTIRVGDFIKPSDWSASHSLKGIFIAFGDGIKPGRVKNITSLDIAPTFLHWMNIAIPNDMDGSTQKSIFSEAFLKNNPVTYTKDEFVDKANTEGLNKKEEKRIVEDLRNLGYL